MIDWSQVTVGVAAVLTSGAVVRFAIGKLIDSLTAPLRSIDERTVRIEALLEQRPASSAAPPIASSSSPAAAT